jgi:short-subunit dehydrogenase
MIAITGAARGIGAATAAEVVRRGGRVLLGDLDGEAVAAVAAGLGPAALSGPLDVTDDASYAQWLALAEVDALVNNAGVMWVGPYDEEPEVAGRRMMDVNFWGVVRGTRLVLPAMRARRAGHVVTVASLASYIGPRGEATYGATKHAVHGWTKAVRAELTGSGVDFSLVMPAVVETELASGTSSGSTARLTPEQVATAVADVLEKPRFEVFVPGRTSALVRLFTLLPQSARDRMYDALVPDQVRVADRAARREYERRQVL